MWNSLCVGGHFQGDRCVRGAAGCRHKLKSQNLWLFNFKITVKSPDCGHTIMGGYYIIFSQNEESLERIQIYKTSQLKLVNTD